MAGFHKTPPAQIGVPSQSREQSLSKTSIVPKIPHGSIFDMNVRSYPAQIIQAVFHLDDPKIRVEGDLVVIAIPQPPPLM
jgi:hypothetical protein